MGGGTDEFNFSNVAGNQPDSSLSGFVYVDANNNGKVDKGEPSLGGVTVVLSGTNSLGSQVMRPPPPKPTARTTSSNCCRAPTASPRSTRPAMSTPRTPSASPAAPSGTTRSPASRWGWASTAPATTSAGRCPGVHQHGGHRPPRACPYSYLATATDADGDPLTFSLLQGPSTMTVSAAGQVSWCPRTSAVGTHPIPLQVSDGRGGLVRQTYNLTVMRRVDQHAAVLHLHSRRQRPRSARSIRTRPRPPTPTATRRRSRS